MREILFKGIVKDADDKLWVKGGFYKYGDTAWILKANECLFSSMEHWQVIPETVCQYTGLIDVDDISVWENDIVKITIYDWHTGKVLSETISPVTYSMGKFGVMHGSLRKFCGFDEFSMYTTFKVIGNVFDNPELLEV